MHVRVYIYTVILLLDISTMKCLHSELVAVIVSWSIQSAVETVCYALKLVPHSTSMCRLHLVAMRRSFLGKFQ